jgi:hypothetical protein
MFVEVKVADLLLHYLDNLVSSDFFRVNCAVVVGHTDLFGSGGVCVLTVTEVNEDCSIFKDCKELVTILAFVQRLEPLDVSDSFLLASN